MRPLLLLSLAGGCAAGAGPSGAQVEPVAAGAGAETRPSTDAPRSSRPPPRWWTRGDAACPGGAHLERREEDDGRVLTCKSGEFPHGPEVAWYESGVRRWERTFLDGELSGLWVRWYPSGKKQSETEYAGGERDGLALEWDKDGELLSRSRWREGQLRERSEYHHGLIQRTVRYHPNGQRASEIHYKNGRREGTATTWHQSGALASRGAYHGGKKQGQWIYADEHGDVVRTEIYDAGELKSSERVGAPAAGARKGDEAR